MKMSQSHLWAFLVLVGSVSSALGQQVPPAWKAGMAREIITPEKAMWMSGYASRNKPATNAYHDLWSKAVVLEDPKGKRAVLVTLDLVGIDRSTAKSIKERLVRAVQTDEASICINCSHTHCGPVVGQNLRSMYMLGPLEFFLVEEYTKNLLDHVERVVRKALDDLNPAKLSHGMGTVGFAVNRRTNKEADVPMLRAAGQLKGPVDHSLPVLVIKDPKGELRGVVAGYACHATTLSFYEWCGDYPGFAMEEWQKRHLGATGMFCAGCGGDQNPLPRRTVELAKSYGTQLADGIDQVLKSPLKEIEGELSTRYQEIPLAFADLPTREKLFETTIKSTDIYEVARANMLLQKWMINKKLDETYPYPIQVWRLGAGPVWVHLGGEVVVDYAIRIKAEHPNQRIWVNGYCNDVMAYIPSLRVLKEGGYEGGGSMVYYGLPSPWAPSIEDRIMTTLNEMLK